MIRIVIIDGQEEYRNHLRSYLSRQKDFKVVGIGNGGYEAVRLSDTYRPDVILMDSDHPLGDGVKTASLIKSRFPRTAVIINSNDERRIFTGFFNGISGYITKKVNPELLGHAIRTVYYGGCLVAPEVFTRISGVIAKLTEAVLESRGELRSASFTVGFKTGPRPASAEETSISANRKLPGTISHSEMQLMGFVGRGYTNREIAEKLRLAEGTIRNRISAVLQKTGLHDRTQVAIYAIKAGL